MSETRPDLKACADELERIFAPFITRVSDVEWTSKEGEAGLVYLCALRRQFDALKVLRSMADAGTCDKGAPLLRPACEELIWIRYLTTLSREDAETLILSKGIIDIERTITAQTRYADDMALSGFTPELIAGIRKSAERMTKAAKAVGTRLGWPHSRNAFPTMKYLAGKADLVEFYDVVYHATSRNVHFTPSELLRMAWGRGRTVRIGEGRMSHYWEAFVLFWGWRLFMLTAHAVTGAFERAGRSLGGIDNGQRILELTVEMGRSGKIPIITAEEMNLHIKEGRETLFE